MNVYKPKLPPGPSYIFSKLLSWEAAGYVLSVAFIRFGASVVGVHAPLWAIATFSVIALPAVLYVQSELQYWKDKRAAVALGARLAPKVSGKKPLGMDMVAALIEVQRSGYIGEP